MKKLIPIILLGLSILLIYLSQQTFYSYPIKTVYRYDGDYKVGGVRYDKDDNKLEEFTYSSYIKDGRLIVEEVDFIYYTFWGNARDFVFVFSILSTLLMIIIVVRSYRDKLRIVDVHYRKLMGQLKQKQTQHDENEEVETYVCSDCEADISIDDSICPKCGANLD